MAQFNIYEAKVQLSRLLDMAEAGEEVIIAKAGKPKARLIAVDSRGSRRVPGRGRGTTRIGDDFDSPLPEELQIGFGMLSGR